MLGPVSSYMSFPDKIKTTIPPDNLKPPSPSNSDEQLLNQLFEQVIQLPEDERPAFLASHCKDNPDLYARIEALLVGVDITPPSNFLEPSGAVQLLGRISELDSIRG